MTRTCAPQCRSCAFQLPQHSDGEATDVGRCTHIAFFKSGLAKLLDQERGTLDVVHDGRQERISPELQTEAFQEGRYYHDLLDVKQQIRVCRQTVHPLAYAGEVLAYYGDDWRNYPFLPQPVQDWFAAGMPMVSQTFEPFSRLDNLRHTRDVPPETVTQTYDVCALCTHFTLDTDEHGAPVPFKGRCDFNKMTDKQTDRRGRPVGGGAWAFGLEGDALREEVQTTYTFFGCTNFAPVRQWTKEEPQPLPVRLMLFIESNPIDVPLAAIQQLAHFPLVNRRQEMSQEALDAVLSTDLTGLLRGRHASMDFNQFYSDMYLQPVADFFSRGLRAESKAYKDFWAPYKGYDGSEDALFANPAVARVAEAAATLDPALAAAQLAPSQAGQTTKTVQSLKDDDE